jgi:hypothetical protein
MTDVMTVGTRGDPLPAVWLEGKTPGEGEATCGCTNCVVDDLVSLKQRTRDLELVCRAQQKALNLLLLSLPASYSKDLKFKIWPEMEAVEMLLNGD